MKKMFCLLLCVWGIPAFQLVSATAYAIDLSSLPGVIAYDTSEGGNGDLIVMRPDGTGQLNVTQDPGTRYGSPFISYDGRQIVYYGGVAGHANIITANIDGDNKSTVVSDGYDNLDPVFSPDGQWITFNNNAFELWKVLKVDGTQRSLLMNDAQFCHWSPNGSYITYMQRSTRDIYVMKSDGTGMPILLAESPGYKNSYPRYSPDGTQIAFFSDKDGTADTWVMDSDGFNAHNLLTGHGWDASDERYFSWSPDGQYVVVESNRSGNLDLWIFEVANPSNAVNITNSPLYETTPHWQTTTHLPEASAGENISICSQEVATIIICGTASDEDPDDVLEYQWKEGDNILLGWTPVGENGECCLDPANIPNDIGTHTLTLVVTDGQDTVSDDMILTINNSAPNAAPTGSGTYQINDPVTLGGQVSDFDGDTLQCDWYESASFLFGATVASIYGGDPVNLPGNILYPDLGGHTFTLRVSDVFNDPVEANMAVEVIDTMAPTLAPVANQTILWPPNHRMADIVIEANASDNSGLPVTLSAVVTSNEPIDGLGDGDTGPDWTEPVIDEENEIVTLQLRAERSGSGDGRVYTVVITATDDSLNSSTASVQIIVPHDKRKKK